MKSSITEPDSSIEHLGSEPFGLSALDFGPLIDIVAILQSWEDEHKNRYFPLGNGCACMRDGGDGTWRGIVEVGQRSES
jgi:hypothetical protein